MDGYIEALGTCRLFQGISEESVRQYLQPRGILREFARGEELIAPHRRVDWFAVVLEGQVHILQLFSDGASSLTDILRPSYVLGADLLCTGSRLSPYYAVAETACRVLIFPGELLEGNSLPESVCAPLRRNMLELIARDNMRKHYRLAILSQHGLRSRVLVYLTMQAAKRGGNTFRIPFSRDEMADYLCVNRSSLSHELSKMERDGLIRFHRNEFTLLAPGLDQSAWSTGS